MNDQIKQQILLLDQGHFERWSGFEGEWTKKIVEESTDSKLNCTGYFLSGKQLSRCVLLLKLQPRELQCFVDDTGKISLLRLEDARLASSDGITKIFGEPEIKRSLGYPDIYSPATQWIYASRGITLYVLDEKPGAAIPLVCTAFYKQTTVTEYLDELGGTETRKYFDYHQE